MRRRRRRGFNVDGVLVINTPPCPAPRSLGSTELRRLRPTAIQPA